MASITKISVEGTMYDISDAAARESAQNALSTANTAKTTADTAKTTAESVKSTVDGLVAFEVAVSESTLAFTQTNP